VVSGSATLTLPVKNVVVWNASMEHIASAHLNSMVRTIIVSTVAHGNAAQTSAAVKPLRAVKKNAAHGAGTVVTVIAVPQVRSVAAMSVALRPGAVTATVAILRAAIVSSVNIAALSASHAFARLLPTQNCSNVQM